MPFRLLLFLGLLISSLQASLFDPAAIREIRSLETKVLQDWKLNERYPEIQQKLVEITVAEWWSGQKVRIPVTLNVPSDPQQLPCKNVIVANMPLNLRMASPSGPALKLLRERGVGVVLVGMGTIDAMEPKGQLHLGMKEKLLHTKDPRYSPAWIWGMSQMRGLTAATAEPAFFQPDKVVSTGGSKRGIATAAAGIHDNRFTGIVPVVAPPLGNPGTPAAIIGTEPSWINGVDAAFLNSVDPGVRKSLEDRRDRREDTRLTLSEVNQQRWKPAEVKELSQILWNASRITAYLDEVNRRGLEYFYCVGTNDSVTPALLQLGRKYPDFPVYIVPGGQHGGPRDAGFTRHVTDEPGVVQNFESFCLHHFFGLRGLPDTPQISAEMKDGYLVVRTLYEGSSPLKENLLSWSYDRHAPYCLPFEYDKWESTEMQAEDHNTYSARIPLPAKVLSIQFLSTHVDWENGIPFFVSSPLSERKVFP